MFNAINNRISELASRLARLDLGGVLPSFLSVMGSLFLISSVTSCTDTELRPSAQILQAYIQSFESGDRVSLQKGSPVYIVDLHPQDTLYIQGSGPGVLESSWNCRVGPLNKGPYFTSRTRTALNHGVALFSLMPDDVVIRHDFKDTVYCNIHLRSEQTGQENFIHLKDVAIQRAVSSGLTLQDVDDEQEWMAQNNEFTNTSLRFTKDHSPLVKISIDADGSATAAGAGSATTTDVDNPFVQLACASVRSKLRRLRQEGQYLNSLYHLLNPVAVVNPVQKCRVVSRDEQGLVQGFSVPFDVVLDNVVPEFSWGSLFSTHRLQASDDKASHLARGGLQSWLCYKNHTKRASFGHASREYMKNMATKYLDTELRKVNNLWASRESESRSVQITNRQKFSQTYRILTDWSSRIDVEGPSKLQLAKCVDAYEKEFRVFDAASGAELVELTLAPGASRSLVFHTPVRHPCSTVAEVTYLYQYKRTVEGRCFGGGLPRISEGERHCEPDKTHTSKDGYYQKAYMGPCAKATSEADVFEFFDLGVFVQLVSDSGEAIGEPMVLSEPSVNVLRTSSAQNHHKPVDFKSFFYVDWLQTKALPYKGL